MPTVVVELNDRFVCDDGSIVAAYKWCFDRISRNLPIDRPVYPCTPFEIEDIALYNANCGTERRQLTLFTDTGDGDGPAVQTFSWITPSEYADRDILLEACERLIEMGKSDAVYMERVEWEWKRIEDRGMIDFLRCLCWIRDEFARANLCMGIGRGSACSSLVLYALGIHRIDPIRYRIDPNEFFKPTESDRQTTSSRSPSPKRAPETQPNRR